MSVRTVVAGLVLVVVPASCGGKDPAAQLQPPVKETTTVASSSPPSTNAPTFVGLRCSGEMDSATYDYEEGGEGFATAEEAARDWMTNGDGATADLGASRLDLVMVSIGSIDLVDEDGVVRAELIARDYGNGWLIERTQRCYNG